MITIISGTNRTGSLTLKYAGVFKALVEAEGRAAQILDLGQLDVNDFSPEMYDPSSTTAAFREVQRRYLLDVDKLVFFVPEYNGSYPGVLKSFIDAASVYETAGNFGGKKIALVGIASGRAGNLRGMDHLADTLAHLGAWVLPSRLPISSAHAYLAHGSVTDETTLSALIKHAQQLIAA